MARVLLVSYHYPPTSAVGALRVAKFAKYLPEFGWDPVVLSAETRENAPATASEGIAPVVRAPVWPGPGSVYRLIQRLRPRRGDRHVDLTFEQKDTIRPGLRATLKRTLVSLQSWPDGAFGWWAPGVLAARKLMGEGGYSAIVTTGPPHTAHLIGLALRRSGVRWIADFRDPWVNNPGKSRSIRSTLSDTFDRRAEAAVVKRADAVLSTTAQLRRQFLDRYPGRATRFHTVINGVDYDDFTGVRNHANLKFTIAHFGTMYYKRSPDPLFAAARFLVDAGVLPRETVALVFAGCTEDGIDLQAAARRHGVSELLEMVGLVSRPRALEMMVNAGALLLFAQDQPLQIPAKAYEYIASGRPIIAVTGEGATADLIRRTGAGTVVGGDDAEALRAAILDAYNAWKRQPFDGPSQRPRDPHLDRRRLTGQLAALLCGDAC
ncbi:MAG TPA: glycosyltransferase [Candidatus Acidoferrum sp.]|nr:glycosyltransferase [Candidatus Acidoferrum sp.]